MTNGEFAKQNSEANTVRINELAKGILDLSSQRIAYHNPVNIFDTETIIKGIKIDRDYSLALVEFGQLALQDLILAHLARVLKCDTKDTNEVLTSRSQQLKKSEYELEQVKNKINNIFIGINVISYQREVKKRAEKLITAINKQVKIYRNLIWKYISTGDETILQQIADLKALINVLIKNAEVEINRIFRELEANGDINLKPLPTLNVQNSFDL